MSDGSHGQTRGWSRRRLAGVLYPFVTATVAVNLFLASLLGARFGLPVVPPVWALVLSLPLGVPATWAACRWVERLLDEAGS